MTVPKLRWFMYWNWREFKVGRFHVTLLPPRLWSWDRGVYPILGGGFVKWTAVYFFEIARRA